MFDVSVVQHILQFAAFLSPDMAEASVSRIAQERGWLDASGHLTEAGKSLYASLVDQRETRSVFRLLV